MILEKQTALKHLLDSIESSESDFDLLYKKACEITTKNFGKKRTLFNPIYVSDICLSDCPYCGYRISNNTFKRKTLKPHETIQEANFLKERGIENILILAGDYKHSKYVEMLVDNIRLLKQEIKPNWIGIEVATLEIEEYEKLKAAGAESVTVFQETYDINRFNQLHNFSEYKGDFDFRFNAQERAIKAGFSEIGFGVLYGVGNWIDDTVSMAEHALNLKLKYPSINIRFSFPRLQESIGQSNTCRTEEISENQLLKSIVGIRLCFPDASLVLTGRETVDFLCKSASIVNILGYDGRTNVGGYNDNNNNKGLNQFQLNTKSDFNYFKSQLISLSYDLHL
jgi:2-iminoacetate synthase